MAARSSFILLAAAVLHCMLYTAHCQKNSTAPTNSLPTDAAVLDVFASPSLYANDTTAAAAAAGIFIEYGLSPNVTDRLAYTGLGTVAYSEEPITSAGALTLGCGFGYINSNFTAAIVGVGSAFYQQGFSCGRCILLQCDDSSCQEPGRQAVAEIVDQYGERLDADLNIGHPLFEKISGRSPSSNPNLSLSWQFVDCSPYINDTIKMLIKPGGTAYYQAFNFANSRQVITAVQVNGQLLRHETNHYWSWSPANGPINPRGPFDFALLGANKEVLRVRLPQLRSVDLGVQFAMPQPAQTSEETPAPAIEEAIAIAVAAAPQAEMQPEDSP